VEDSYAAPGELDVMATSAETWASREVGNEIAMIHTREYSRFWTVADQADQPSLQPTLCRRCD
jgi:hypothetical protein